MAESATFVWEGTDKQGRKSKGEISSSTPAIAKAELRRQGIVATKVKKKGAGLSLGGGGKGQTRRHRYFYPPDGNYDACRCPTGTGIRHCR